LAERVVFLGSIDGLDIEERLYHLRSLKLRAKPPVYFLANGFSLDCSSTAR